MSITSTFPIDITKIYIGDIMVWNRQKLRFPNAGTKPSTQALFLWNFHIGIFLKSEDWGDSWIGMNSEELVFSRIL